MKSMTIKNVNLNGLKLNGDQPLTPRTRQFFRLHNAEVSKNDGYLIFSGKFNSFSAKDVQEFLKNKASEDVALLSKEKEESKTAATIKSIKSKKTASSVV